MNKSVKSKENYKLKQIILPRCYMQKSIDIAGCLLYNENVKIYNFTQKGACIIVLYDEDFLSGEQQKIEDCYTEIGRQYYASHKNDAEPEFADLFDSVKKSEKAMADHKAEVLLANGLMLCPRCGEQIYYKSIFCNFCGIRVVEEKPAEPVAEEPAAEEPAPEETVAEEPVPEGSAVDEPDVSGFTDTEIDMESDFEDFHFEKAPVSEPEPDEEQLPESEPDIAPAFEPAPAADSEPANGKIICKHCGAEIDDDCFFCIECGKLVEKDEMPAAKTEEKSQQDNVRFCKCGYRVTDPEAVFCNSCGSRLESSSFAGAAKPSIKKRCPRCGFTTDDPGVLFCIECGHKL